MEIPEGLFPFKFKVPISWAIGWAVNDNLESELAIEAGVSLLIQLENQPDLQKYVRNQLGLRFEREVTWDSENFIVTITDIGE